MANTLPDGIWYPDADTTPMVLDSMFSTLASSIQNGIGKRVGQLEVFSDMGGRGVVGKDIATYNVSGVGGSTPVLLNATLPVNLVAGRNYRVVLKGNYYANAANQAYQLFIRRSATNPNPTLPAAPTPVDDMTIWTNALLDQSGSAYNVVTYFTPTVTATQYLYLTAQRIVGGGTGIFNATSVLPRIFFVEDAGKA